MQPEDSQIDVLLKRHGGHAPTGAPADHLDADELNAFAEGAAPAAARSRYVSHLAECHDCRRLATQLSSAAGATANAGAGAIETAGGSLWQKLTSFFAPPMLRYAAFAAVLVVAVGVTFLALRRQGNSTLVARNEQTAEKEVSAVKPGEPSAPQVKQTAQTFANPSATVSHPAENRSSDLKAQTQSREERAAQSVAKASGPRKAEPSSDKLKEMDRSVGGISQNRAAEGDDIRTRNNQAMNQQSTNQQTQQSQNRIQDSNSQAATQGNLAVNRTRDEVSNETARKPTTGAARRESEKPPETRSAGGHKFRRQGNAWVDSKFKSSMSITNVARGSEAFRSLDPAVRSMAEQLGGEVIVVSKGKAYRIR